MRSEIAIASLLLDYINETSQTNNPGPSHTGYIDRVSSQHVVVAGLPRASENIIELSIKCDIPIHFDEKNTNRKCDHGHACNGQICRAP